jgi:diaminopropionate ammonia-lyase
MNPHFDSATLAHTAVDCQPGKGATTTLTPDNFATAFNEITQWQGYAPTQLYQLSNLAREIGVGQIFYKDEGPRFGLGSFKALGGAYAALRILRRELSTMLGREVSTEEIRSGALAEQAATITLVSATDGNHGRSLAWGAGNFGATCRIYIHREVSDSRADAIAKYGAEVIRVDGDYDMSVREARREADENGWFAVSDTSWEGYTEPPRDVMSGYGVMIDEVAEQMPQAPTHVFVQGGVGGLAAGVSARLRQHYGNDFRIVVVEPELAACLLASAGSGHATTVPIHEETLMAGLSCGEPSALAWDVLAYEAGDYLSIPESLVAPTMKLLAKPDNGDPAIVAGESAVCGMAALIAACRQPALGTALQLTDDSRVLVIGSEGATDPEIYAQLVA